MNFNFNSINEFHAYFKNERICYEFLESTWWKDGAFCPHCGSMKQPYILKTDRNGKDVPAYRCSESACKLFFTIKTGSVFEGTKIDLMKWFHAIYEISINKKGISSVTLADKINISQKSAWLILQKLRDMNKNSDKNKEDKRFTGTNQIDETFVGGKNKNRHHDKKVEKSQGRSFKDKTPVLGILNEESKQIRLFVIPDTSAEAIEPILYENIQEESIVYTDEWKAYYQIGKVYQHCICDHSRGTYVSDNGATTNKVENFWSIFKRGIIGIYHKVSRKHLQLYCNEFEVRYNNRELDKVSKFLHFIKSSFKERITYMALTRTMPSRPTPIFG